MADQDGLLENAVEKSIAFLQGRQLPHGEFRMLSALDEDLSNPEDDGSVFPTAVAVYSASFVDRSRVKDTLRKSLDFLVREMLAPGFWSYWSASNPKKSPIDLDTTSYVLSVLKQNGVSVPEDRERLLANRDEHGRFHTWLLNDELRSIGGHYFDINPVVNANLLTLLGHSKETDGALQFVLDCVTDESGKAAITYYLDRLWLYYSASRAFHCGVACLGEVSDHIVHRVELRLNAGENWDAMRQALAVCSLLNFSKAGKHLRHLVSALVNSQRQDGSWPAIAMYYGAGCLYGSEELTTALCLEALSRSSRTSGEAQA